MVHEKMLNTFIQEFREEFMEFTTRRYCISKIVEWSKKITSSDVSNLFKKGTPIHVKGGILYNHLVKKHKLGNKYPYIQEGDKIKFCISSYQTFINQVQCLL